MTTARRVLSVEEYLAELVDHLLPDAGPLAATEELPLAEALGRVLAAPVHAAGDVPAFANSGMDGYAVRHADLEQVPVTLEVVGDVPAGSGEGPRIDAGQCVRIMTGAPLPSDADTVVPVELTDGGSSTVTITEVRDRGQHVRGAGEDLQAGDVVATAGTSITGRVLGSLAASGTASVTVRRRPVVAIAATRAKKRFTASKNRPVSPADRIGWGLPARGSAGTETVLREAAAR